MNEITIYAKIEETEVMTNPLLIEECVYEMPKE